MKTRGFLAVFSAVFSALLLAALLPSFAGASTGGAAQRAWMTLLRTGHDLNGNSGYDRFELLPNRRVTWRTATMGMPLKGGCAPGGGTLRGRIKENEAEELQSLAEKALRSLAKADPDPGGSPREFRTLLSLTQGGRTEFREIARATPAVLALERALASVRTGLAPAAALSLRAERLNARKIRVIFASAGSESIRFAVPANAETAFWAEGIRLGHVAPRESAEIELGPSKRRFALDLEAPRGTTVPRGAIVSYSNPAVPNRGLDTAELFLCTALR